MKRIVFVTLFPVMLLIVNPLNDLTSFIREWWEHL